MIWKKIFTKNKLVISAGIIFLFSLFSCKKETKNFKNNHSDNLLQKDLKIRKNDNFRILVVKNIKDSQNQKFCEKYADKLDKENISFEDFMSKVLSSEDSCYDIASKKIPNPSMQKEYSEYIDKLIEQIELKYQKKYNLTKKEYNDITGIWAFNKDARKLVGKN